MGRDKRACPDFNSETPEDVTNSATHSSPQTPSERIAAALTRLRQLTQVSVQSQWHSYTGDLPVAAATQADTWQKWPIAPLNSLNYITWAKGRSVLWLGQRIVVPHNLQGYPLQGLTLRLALGWWAQVAQIYLNGKLIQAGDLFDNSARILLSPAVTQQAFFDVAIRLESPGHDAGALVRSLCIYECPAKAVNLCPEPGFVADELAVLQTYLAASDPAKLETVAAAIAQLPWSVLSVTDRLSFDKALASLRQQLQPLGDWLKQRRVQLLGHSHLDMAWLWTASETCVVAEHTFKSVLQLQQDFPELTFCHTSPALYAWIEQNRPQLFAAIQAQVAAGRWEATVAPLWIEPELNTVGGESLVRQVLYGQQYIRQKFGKPGSIAWLPDSFGFCWQLPQILKQGGVDYFVTQKLRWNDTTQFPYEVYWWRSPDGSQIFSLNSAPIGEQVDPVKIADYARVWETKTGLQTALWLPGVGDHGGGPSRDMLEIARRWQQSPFFPQLEFTTASQFLQSLEQQSTEHQSTEDKASARALHPASSLSASPSNSLPVWNSELYLEFHRGCYTNHADQKKWNRRCEEMLYEAELFASLRTLITGAGYPQTALEDAWKKVLFNQFHDILPGSAIAPVYVDANRTWQEAMDTGWNVRQEALQAIAAQIALPPRPHPAAQLIVIFNSLSWVRSEVAIVSVEQTADPRSCFWQICDLEGREIQSQPHCWREGGKTYCQIFFRADNVPAIGYRCFWLTPRTAGNPVPPTTATAFVLENERVRATVDPATGNLASLFDKVHQRDLLSRAGNELQFFRDSGQYWDAWNIDPNYAQHPLPPAQLVQIFYEDQGAITTRIRVVRRIGQSTFNQLYSLDKDSAVLKIQTQVDWQERHVLVKAAFPLNIDAAYATYEIPCGAIQRPTRPQTAAEKAQWEVPALRWADLSDSPSNNSYGVSLLNDSKHGYDSKPNQLRITLLRGSEWPDPHSDQGQHQFTYALYAHDRTWQAAQTVQRGYELNQPLRVFKLNPAQSLPTGKAPALPPTGEFLNLPPNLILTAFKRSEEQPNQWILRCYECHGEAAKLPWQDNTSLLFNYLNPGTAQAVNLLEQADADASSSAPTAAIAPWKIATFVLKQK